MKSLWLKNLDKGREKQRPLKEIFAEYRKIARSINDVDTSKEGET